MKVKNLKLSVLLIHFLYPQYHVYHPKLRSLKFFGKFYRGSVINQAIISHYIEESLIITTTFLSTSKTRTVAEFFANLGSAMANTNKISFICIFTIKDEHRTALDIANHSEIPDEEEVLILPYSSFKITNIMQNENQRRIEMYSEECDTVPLDFQTIV
jgi:hypothetical protein